MRTILSLQPAFMPNIQLRQLSKNFGPRHAVTAALSSIDLDIAAGQSVALLGPSGSGKSTLVRLLCGIERPSSGQIRVGDVDLGSLDEAALTRWRGLTVGLVFQAFELLPSMTALENVMLPMELTSRWPRGEQRARAMTLLTELGVPAQSNKLPADMSGGEQQRVALARALANDPPLILADEPTGNLDSANGERVLQLLAAVATRGKTVVMVTHDPRHRAHFVRSIELRDGRLA
jgi:ABC-type lipoprotein export system ATPase subunit